MTDIARSPDDLPIDFTRDESLGSSRRNLALSVGRRLIAGLLVAWIAVSITFFVVRVLPGDPAALVAGPNATAESLASVRADLGLNQPIPIQYVRFMVAAAHLDFGTSIQTGHPVISDITARLPATLELTISGLLIGVASGLVLGLILGARRGVRSAPAELLTVVAVAVPEFWLGLILILIFYSWLGWAPAPIGRVDPYLSSGHGPTGFLLIDSIASGDTALIGSAVGHLILPAVTLAALAIPSIARITGASLRTVLAQDFVLACRANGDRGLHLYALRVLPVALPPVITNIGVVTGYLLAGDFLLEKVFAWPGVGLYAVTAVQDGDFAAVQAVVLLVALVYVLVFTGVDILNSFLDPRGRSTAS